MIINHFSLSLLRNEAEHGATTKNNAETVQESLFHLS